MVRSLASWTMLRLRGTSHSLHCEHLPSRSHGRLSCGNGDSGGPQFGQSAGDGRRIARAVWPPAQDPSLRVREGGGAGGQGATSCSRRAGAG